MEQAISYWGLSPASLVLLLVGLVVLVISVVVFVLGTLQHRNKRAMRRMRGVGNQKIDPNSAEGQSLTELKFHLDPDVAAGAKDAQQPGKRP